MAYYALHEFSLMPWDFAALETDKKAALTAMILVRVEEERRERTKIKKK
ncbi:hypothetical protein [Cohnella cellulosilytica]|uniref:Uncharacterized protein n=1 Tax=Cohnella cellulosilytica TaxID=986710 RepID=A0ABW2FK83_9BACL